MDEPRSTSKASSQAIGSESCRLTEAKSAIERVLGRSGAEHWSAFDYDSEKSRQISCLKSWADAAGAWLDRTAFELWEQSLGMGEHDLKELDGRMWKATKGGKFGIWFHCSGRAVGDPVRQIRKTKGTPHQYLSRLMLLNEWRRELVKPAALPEMNRLEGVAVLDGEFSIITSQPLFPHDASQPSHDELREWFKGLGFRQATGGIYYRASDNLAIFDVKPSNVIRSGGMLVPLDVIPIRPGGVMHDVLRRASAP